jgi:ABC-type microcin C transport system permease subunit YejB
MKRGATMRRSQRCLPELSTRNDRVYSSASASDDSDAVRDLARLFRTCPVRPGWPVEQQIAKVQGFASARGGAAKTISAAEIENIKAYYGFDQPAHIRYVRWLGNVLRFDLGKSYAYQKPVSDVIVSKMPVSLFFGSHRFSWLT